MNMHTLLARRPRRCVGMSMPKSKSLRYILASPGYDPGTIAVNITCRMERGFNACQTHRSMYPSIFNHFWNIAIYRWRVIDFQQSREVNERFFYHILFSLGTPYPSIFNGFWDIASLLVENCDIFIPHLCLAAPQGVTPSEFREDLDIHKTRMNGLSCAEESMTICSAVLIQYQRVTDEQTDGRTSSL